MAKKTPIQIDIPRPCHENWDKMSATDKGRFCKSCQKEVIDFTNWSDIAIYSFLKQQNGAKVCGRFCNTQLNRPINIPPQPHSRLYKLFIGLGLTLAFVSALPTITYAQPPLININESPNCGEQEPDSTNIIIKGKVVDETNNPVIGCFVRLMSGDHIVHGVPTSINGEFTLVTTLKEFDNLYLECLYSKYIPGKTIITEENISDYHTISLLWDKNAHAEIDTTGYFITPINRDAKHKYIITGELIEDFVPLLEKPCVMPKTFTPIDIRESKD